MKTIELLRDEYHAAIIPAETFAEKYLGIANKNAVNDRINSANFPIPAFKIGKGKSPFFVHLNDMADYIDKIHKQAKFEFNQMGKY